MTPDTLRAARLAAGAKHSGGFDIWDEQPGHQCVVWPPARPGHPRRTQQIHGFRFYNNVALAAIARTELSPP